MKVLKRPMFRYGGGVKKQGIMHGMKGMQDGGPATMADATGYANGGMTMFPPMRGRVTRPGGYAGKQPNYMGNNINNMGGSSIENFYKNNQANVRGDYSKINQPPKVLTRDERIQKQQDVFKPSYTIQDLYEKNMNVTDEQIPQETRYGVVMVDNPNYGRVKRVDKAIADADAEGPVGIEGKDLTGKNLTGEITAEGPVGIEGKDLTGKNLTGLPGVSSRKETDEKRLKRIYEIMDVDGAKKDAAYNALIDLSQGQAIDTKDISGSINRAIGALSKRADKVTDLKDKGKAALASGTIQEMFRDKESAADKKLSAYAKASGKTKEFVANKELGLANSLQDAVSLLRKEKKGQPITAADIVTTAMAYGEEKGIPFKQTITTEQKREKVGKGKDYATVVDLVQALELNPDGSDDGIYVVGTSIIQVEKGVAKLKG
jgi:hypothetical protein